MTNQEPGGVRLGILTQQRPLPDGPGLRQAPFVQTVSELAAAEGVTVRAFDPMEVDWDRHQIRGEPLPDVVWDRYYRRDRPDVLHRFQRLGIPVFNETALSKWDAYRCLRTDVILQEHLPETRLLAGEGEVPGLCSRYPVLFLKPVAGGMGRGIIRVWRQPTGLFHLQYVAGGSGEFCDEEATLAQVDRWAHERRGTYIVQQGLDLAVVQGRPADVRVLLQKDATGCWRLTGMGARIAAPGRFTANLHTGGTGAPVSLLAEAVFPGDREQQELLLLELHFLAMRTAELLECEAGTMGEIGLDFGVDRQGRIWYIEQNAQPGRTIFAHLGRQDLFQLAHLRPIQYARWLATTKSARAAGYAST